MLFSRAIEFIQCQIMLLFKILVEFEKLDVFKLPLSSLLAILTDFRGWWSALGMFMGVLLPWNKRLKFLLKFVNHIFLLNDHLFQLSTFFAWDIVNFYFIWLTERVLIGIDIIGVWFGFMLGHNGILLALMSWIRFSKCFVLDIVVFMLMCFIVGWLLSAVLRSIS